MPSSPVEVCWTAILRYSEERKLMKLCPEASEAAKFGGIPWDDVVRTRDAT